MGRAWVRCIAARLMEPLRSGAGDLLARAGPADQLALESWRGRAARLGASLRLREGLVEHHEQERHHDRDRATR